MSKSAREGDRVRERERERERERVSDERNTEYIKMIIIIIITLQYIRKKSRPRTNCPYQSRTQMVKGAAILQTDSDWARSLLLREFWIRHILAVVRYPSSLAVVRYPRPVN